MYRSGDEDEEPDWVKDERERFSGYRDKNKDGFMDTEEVKSFFFYINIQDDKKKKLRLFFSFLDR